MRKSVGQAPTAGEQTKQKPCQTSSDIGAELENHNVGLGPMYDRKGLNIHFLMYHKICTDAANEAMHKRHVRDSAAKCKKTVKHVTLCGKYVCVQVRSKRF
jgi:hypothetical protein